MRGVVGRAELRFGLLPEWGVVKPFAAVPAAIIAAFGIGRDLLERLAEAEFEQNARGVGGNLNTGTHLAERGGLFVELHIDAALAQRQHGGDPPDSPGPNENLQTPQWFSEVSGRVSQHSAAFVVP